MAKLARKEKAHKDSGNIVVDLGEEVDKHIVRRVDQKLAAAGVSLPKKEQMAGPGDRFGGYKPGGYRPGMFGYRPWYADKDQKGGSMGAGIPYAARWRGLGRPNLAHLAVGGLIGTFGNAALTRVTPDIVKTNVGIVHDGIAFLVGLIPLVARPNAYTLGVAAPGAFVLAMSAFNYAMDGIGIKKPALLRGGAQASPVPKAGIEASVAARAKLADVHNRISNPGAGSVPRVTAQAVA
jgi:hypothetical protein